MKTNKILEIDIIKVGKTIGVNNLTNVEINNISENYDGEQLNDPSANWSEVVENQIYQELDLRD